MERPASLDELTARARPYLERWREARARPVAELMAEARARPRSAHVRLFAPLYLANPCANDCAYCGFRRSARHRRTLLTAPQAVREAEALAAAGHRSLDLVTGEVPHERFVGHVARVTEAILRVTEIERLHLNLGALSSAHYRRLRAAGARGYHLYQETYASEVYARVHRAGPKRDLAHRLGAPERALAAGFDHLGLGILLGLAPLEHDLVHLAAHAARLLELFPGLALGFSLPRLQALPGADFAAPDPVDDEAFVRALLFLRAEFPAADLTVTTREPAELRDRLIPLGVTKLSAGVSTAPGGYATHAASSAQFPVRDARSLDQVAARVRAAGLEPVTC